MGDPANDSAPYGERESDDRQNGTRLSASRPTLPEQVEGAPIPGGKPLSIEGGNMPVCGLFGVLSIFSD